MRNISKDDYYGRLIAKLTTQVQKLKAELHRYRFDHLTGFALRADFVDMLDTLWYEHKTNGTRFVYAMLDINGLHDVNRDHGMDYGDILITDVADALKEQFEDCFIYRIGGDEFCILKRGSGVKNMTEKLEMINNVEYSVVKLHNDMNVNFKNVDEVTKYLDNIIIEKKSSLNRRSSDRG